MAKRVSAADMILLLAKRYCAPAWAFIPQVREATGAGYMRTADAVAMSLWPSRGLEVHGFEIKVWRTDWQRELRKPEKAEAVSRFCDRWWVVASDSSIVGVGELPPTWGLLVKDGTRLKVAKDAPKLDGLPLDRPFLASLLRRVAKSIAPALDVKTAEEAYEEGKRAATHDHRVAEATLDRLRADIHRFEEASGVKIADAWAHGRIGEAVKVVVEGQLDQRLDTMRRAAESMRNIAAGIDRELERLNSPAEATVLPLPSPSFHDLMAQ